MNEFINTDLGLLNELASIIEQGKQQITAKVNSTITITYWHIGRTINEHLLNNKRAEYGKLIISNVSNKLVSNFGRSFNERNLRRMMQFSEEFPEIEIVTSLMPKLSLTHFIALLPIKLREARMFYANKASEDNWSKRELSRQIERKSYERHEIATMQSSFNFFIATKIKFFAEVFMIYFSVFELFNNTFISIIREFKSFFIICQTIS